MDTLKYGFTTFFKDNGLYFFSFNDKEGKPLLYSYGYPSKDSRDAGIERVIENARRSSFYEYKETNDGQHFFITKLGENQEIGRSRLFSSKVEMEEKQHLLLSVGKEVPIKEIGIQKAQIDEPHKKTEAISETKEVPMPK